MNDILASVPIEDRCPRNQPDGAHSFKRGAFVDSPIRCRYCGSKQQAAGDPAPTNPQVPPAVSLTAISSALLPPLAYAHSADHDSALTAPMYFRPIVSEGWVKPKSGTGLWTAPVVATGADGSPTDTAWLIYTREEMDGPEGAYTHLTEIKPDGNARVLQVDTQADLIAIVAAYPAAPVMPGLHRGPYPDWAALAQDWDAVYLTDEGQWATRLPRTGPDLYSWDVATVLWLRPAYRVGRTVAVPSQRAEVVR